MHERITVPLSVHKKELVSTKPFFKLPKDLSVIEGRRLLSDCQNHLTSLFNEGIKVPALLLLHSDFFDHLITCLYKKFKLDRIKSLCIIAVGGYGRQELFLRSDIDILVLTAEPLNDEAKTALEGFISFLWDLKLDIGSSVRTIAETMSESSKDLTIRTNLLERRLICGSKKTFVMLNAALKNDISWNSQKFLRQKFQEQIERHRLYKDTAYLLEPDVKNNPGCLRDIQTILWIANFHFRANTIEDMLNLGLLSESEYEELTHCQEFLFYIRFALHIVTSREDNRLTLDTQKNVAKILGYGDDGNLPVEKMMRGFFRIVRRVRELNAMILQLETLRITGRLGDADQPEFLNTDFLKRGPLIDAADPEIFSMVPWKMLEVFLLISSHPQIEGLYVNCLKNLREARRALNGYLVEIPECRTLFKQILEDEKSLTTTLPLMHEHRMLSAYMQQWEHIEGLTQFDMFHAFTVDEHTIRALKNIALFNQSTDPVYNLFRNVYHQLSEPKLLNVAAFLHDIGKGRGGGHAAAGAAEAANFCQLHGFGQYQSRMVAWMVQNHLLMSTAALRRDPTDPMVAADFAKKVQDEEHLNFLYCLTVIDIAATNDREWTSWKDSLFRQLYFAVRQALRRGLESTPDLKLHAAENQEQALRLLKKDISEEQCKNLWNNFAIKYFISYTPEQIAWHTKNILSWQDNDEPLILFAQLQQVGTEIFIYSKESPFKFPEIASVMAARNLAVTSASISKLHNNASLCTITFQTVKGDPLENARLQGLRRALLAGFNEAPVPPVVTGRHLKNQTIFSVPTVITFLESANEPYTSLEISTLDTTGLLAKIGIALGHLGCQILSARITTTGERADDFFIIVNSRAQPLNAEEKKQVEKTLYTALEAKN